ncbi:MAG TPA: alkaline phosphatase [Vicinamibacterales bacterium]|nr:alkaline phosphatase [Vicinamibacterales bacterium]
MRMRSVNRFLLGAAATTLVAGAAVAVTAHGDDDFKDFRGSQRAKNVILFIGDGMGVSTITATRVYSVGVAGQLVMDQFPYTALSRTYSADSITPDSAPTMTAMMTGQNANAGVLGLDDTTEFGDFNGDGDGKRLRTLLEQAKRRDMKVGVVSTARITHATPAATYAHINNRDNENAIALQSLPSDGTYNQALEDGIDVLFGGGRRHFVPNTVFDEESARGSRPDGRDLRSEYQAAGYTYVHNTTGFNSLNRQSLPVLGLFEASHMEWEFDRTSDAAGEPSLTQMTLKAIDLLKGGQRKRGHWNRDNGYFLMVESGRIDHAHHDGNALRALHDTQELDEAIGAAIRAVDLRDTLIIVSADHSHVFNIAGYPIRPLSEMPYPVEPCPGSSYGALAGNGVLDLVYDVNPATGCVSTSTDNNGTPYTALVYGNGPGYRGTPRVDPTTDPFVGVAGSTDFPGPNPTGFAHPNYRQEAAVPFVSETHSAEEVAIYAIGAGSEMVRGTVKNTFIYRVMAKALGF